MKDTQHRKRLPLKRSVRNAVFLKFDNRCAYCERPAHAIDHVVPYSVIGNHDEDNLVACCNRCNSAAKDKVFKDFDEKKTWIQGWRAGRDFGVEPQQLEIPKSYIDPEIASLNLRELMKRYRMRPTKKALTKLGARLSEIIGREEPYSYRYLHSIYRSNLETVGLPICLAIEKALETYSSLADYSVIEVYSRPDQAGALVIGRVGPCANPDCGIKFLTDHPNRRFCKICHPPVRR